MTDTLQAGVCRHCGCRGDCRTRDGDECCWADAGRTVCSKGSCITAERRRLKAERQAKRAAANAARRKHGEKFVGMGFGAVVIQMRREECAERRKEREL